MQDLDRLKDEISTMEARALLLLWGYENGSRGECRAKARTMALKLERDPRSVKRYLSKLSSLGLLIKTDRRMRFSIRNLSDRGRLLARLICGERFQIRPTALTTPQMSSHLSPHNGKADLTPKKKEKSALGYTPKRSRGSLTAGCWKEIAFWMDESGSMTSLGRCKIAHRTFTRFRNAIESSSDWAKYRNKAQYPYAEMLLMDAVTDARRAGAKFGTVESALAYIGAIVQACLKNNRSPGPCVKDLGSV